MPGMDGYEVCRHLKGDEGTSDVPIVFKSVLGKTEDKVKVLLREAQIISPNLFRLMRLLPGLKLSVKRLKVRQLA